MSNSMNFGPRPSSPRMILPMPTSFELTVREFVALEPAAIRAMLGFLATMPPNIGKVIEVKGVVIDVAFEDRLPGIYNALEIEIPTGEGEETRKLVAEALKDLLIDGREAATMRLHSK